MSDQIPYFAVNRDETDIAYEAGWKAYTESEPMTGPYQKQSLNDAYVAGWAAADVSWRDPRDR